MSILPGDAAIPYVRALLGLLDLFVPIGFICRSLRSFMSPMGEIQPAFAIREPIITMADPNVMTDSVCTGRPRYHGFRVRF